MSKYDIPDPELLLECPYDKAHMVRAKRMQRHLINCRRSHRGSNTTHCPFNHRHVVPQPELRYHMSICRDKARLDQDLTETDEWMDADKTRFRRDNEGWTPPPSEENWEDDATPGWIQGYGAMKGLSAISVPNWNNATEKRELLAYKNVREYEERQKKELNIRAPREPPKVLSQNPHVQTAARPPTQPPVVFAYSIQSQQHAAVQQQQEEQKAPSVFSSRMSGISSSSNAAAMLQALARGRGIGRSTPLNALRPEPVPGAGGDIETSKPATTAGRGLRSVQTKGPVGGISSGTASSILTSMGRGRGARMNGIIDNMNGVPMDHGAANAPLFSMSNGDSGPSAASFVVPRVQAEHSRSSSPASSNGDDDDTKKLKKLEKKLRSIELLEMKVAQGKTLNDDEKEKLANKHHVVLQHAELMMQMSESM